MIILDTDVVSEIARATPSADVVAWLRQTPALSFAITAVTVAEIEFGIARLPTGARQAKLRATVDRLLRRYSAFVLPFDDEAARTYGSLRARGESFGRPISGCNAQIASIALSRRAELATRNVEDYLDLGVALINPWDRHRVPTTPPA